MHGRVSVDDLAVRFDVTPQTIRKDLNDLCDLHLLSRVHGGAMVSSGVENLGYGARRQIASAEKRAIGEAAAKLIPNNSSLFLNIGTTTEEVARALRNHEGLLVITNNLNIATLLYAHPKIEVIVAGGPVRRSDGGVIGGAAVDFIKQFKVDFAVVGTSAIDPQGALLDYDFREVKVSQAIHREFAPDHPGVRPLEIRTYRTHPGGPYIPDQRVRDGLAKLRAGRGNLPRAWCSGRRGDGAARRSRLRQIKTIFVFLSFCSIARDICFRLAFFPSAIVKKLRIEGEEPFGTSRVRHSRHRRRD